MDSINIYDGLVLTIISIAVVFIVLASIWGLIEVVSRIVNGSEPAMELVRQPIAPVKTPQVESVSPNKKNQFAAEMMALILASENEPGKKFEIVEAKRIK